VDADGAVGATGVVLAADCVDGDATAAVGADLTAFFCFLGDVVFRGTADRFPGSRLRIFRIRPRS
jgi:hypothetical protein